MPVRLDRRRFLLAAGAAAASTRWLGCGHASPGPSGPAVSTTVTVGTAPAGPVLSSRFAGFSYEKTRLTVPLFTPDNAAFASVLRLVGPGVLRIGANGVDTSSWQGAVPGLTPITPAQVDAFCALMKAVGWQVVYGVNLAKSTPAAAADEAAFVAARLGSNLLAFEIGNEVDLYGGNGDRPSGWSYTAFLSEWQQVAAAIRASVPDAPLSGPATASSVNGYAVPFARDVGADVTLLTHHYYRANGKDPGSTLELLLAPDPALGPRLDTLVGAAAAHGIPGGFRMAECNSFYNGGAPNVSDAHGTALWVLDYLFTCALHGATGVNLHGGGNGPGYTPIGDASGVVVGLRPEFHGVLLFANAAQGRALPATATPASPVNVTAYGVARTDGGRNVVVVNKDGGTAIDATVATGAAATAWESLLLTGPDLSSPTGTTLGGAAVAADGTWSPSTTRVTASGGVLRTRVPPASAVLLRST